MRSDTILIDNQGNGFENVQKEVLKVAVYNELNPKETMQLQLCAEEMLSLAHSVTGEMEASFYVECTDKAFSLHMTTETIMELEKRQLLLYAASSRKNDAAKGFLGKLRDILEQAMMSDTDVTGYDIPMTAMADLPSGPVRDPEWDGYERSILRKVADNIRIGIRGGLVDVTVEKKF